MPLPTGEQCTTPSVKATSYTPTDAQVLTHIPYVAEFALVCGNDAQDVNLYADVGDGALVPAIRVQEGSNRYQVSWTRELRHAKTGDHEVRLYDEEGHAAFRRAAERGGEGGGGDPAAAAKPLVTILVEYPGAYKGAYVNSELLAAALAAMVFYLAYSSKAALLA